MVSFNEIPSALRVPLFYAEFDNSRAVQGPVNQPYNMLIIGNKLAAGSAAALDPKVVTSVSQAEDLFGKGSIIADMAKYHLKSNRIHELTCVGLEDDGAAAKAGGNILFSGTATASGVVSAMLGGKNVRISVASGDTAADVVSALVAEMGKSENDDLLVTGAIDGADSDQLNLEAKNGGEFGNEIPVLLSYFDGESLPEGLSATITDLSGGAGNPDIDTVWPEIGEKQYILISTPYTDSQNLGKIESELADRFGPLRKNDGYSIQGKRGDLSALQTLGDSRNSQFTTVLAALGPNAPWQHAASAMGEVAKSASIDPARPFQTLVMPDILPAKEDERFTLEERNLLLFDGIATTSVDAGGRVRIEAMITTFKQNAFGAPDTSYLYLNTPLTLSFLRFDLEARITSRYPRHKLVDDGTRFDPGIAAVTPNQMKAEILMKFREWERRALVENFEQFAEELIVERNDSNPNRLDILMPPDLANQLRIAATQIQFLL